MSRRRPTEYNRKYASILIDVMFKRLFGTERNKKLLATLLTLLLGQEVVDLEFENSERLSVADLEGKVVRLDVLATVRTRSGLRQVNVEVQSVGHPSLTKRALFYASRLYSSQLRKGSDYGDLIPAVVIFILDFIHFSESLQPVSRFGLVERTRGSPLLPEDGEMELVFLELPKVRETVDIQSKTLSRLEYWLLFLAAQDDETLEIIRMTAQDPDLEDAFSEIEFAALSKKEKQLYQARIDGLRDQRTILREKTAEAMAVGEAKGEAKGRAEGKAEGLAEGEAKGRAEGLAEGRRAQLLQLIKLRFGADALNELEPLVCQLKPEDLTNLFAALFDAKDPESARAILAGS